MERIKNLEFLKIIGCISIVLYHAVDVSLIREYTLVHALQLYQKIGNICVELFFILAGLFFVLTFKKETKFIDFLIKKIFRLYPVFIFSSIICYFLPFVNFDLYDFILMITNLSASPLCLKHTTFLLSFWFVNAMLLTLFSFFYLFKNYELKNLKPLFALMAFFGYSIILHYDNGRITSIMQWWHFINIGTLRALSGISLGCLIGFWYKDNKENIALYIPNTLQKTLISLAEFGCIYLIINYLFISMYEYKNDIIFILAFMAIIMLFLVKKGIISKFLDNDICSKISKYIYSIYVTHFIIRSIFIDFIYKNKELVQNYTLTSILIFLVATFAFGIITYHSVEKPCYDYYKNKLLKQH